MSNNQFEIRKTAGKGKGVFSLVHFEQNQILFKFIGQIITEDKINTLSKEAQALVLQVNKTKYLDLNGETSLFCNHSCNPNTLVKLIGNTAFLIAIRNIKPHDEICYDYSTTSSDTIDTWSMNCKCETWNCRKIISGFNLLSQKDKERYLKMGLVPKYIIK